MEVVDTRTGALVAVEREPTGYDQALKRAVLVKLRDGRELLVDPRITKAELDERLGKRYIYSEMLASLICSHLASGKRAKEIAEMVGMPDVRTMSEWRLQHPYFKNLWEEAMKMYAEDCAAQATIEAREGLTASKDTIPGKKLYVDTMKWAAEKADPASFGQKIKVDGEIATKTTLIIETGIRRSGDPGFQASPIKPPTEIKEVKEADPAMLAFNEPLQGGELVNPDEVLAGFPEDGEF